MDIVGDVDYHNSHILVWDISPNNPISLTPWDLWSKQTISRLAFKDPGFTSETASRVLVF